MKIRPLALALAAAGALSLTACGNAQEVCDNLNLSDDAQQAADAAAREGFEVEKEVESEDAGTVECVWDPSESRLVGSSDSE